jgi:hypothetical protein
MHLCIGGKKQKIVKCASQSRQPSKFHAASAKNGKQKAPTLIKEPGLIAWEVFLLAAIPQVVLEVSVRVFVAGDSVARVLHAPVGR